MSVPVRSAVADLNTLPQSSSSRSSAPTDESPSYSAVPRSASRPVQGSAAARFTVRSANSVPNLGLRINLRSLQGVFKEAGGAEAEAAEVAQTAKGSSSTSHQRSPPREAHTDMDSKERGRAPSRVKFTPDTKVATGWGTRGGTASDVTPRCSADADDAGKASSPIGSARGRNEWRKVNMQSRSKSLDLRGGVEGRSPAGTQHLSTLGASVRRAESLERKEVSNLDRRGSYKDCDGVSRISSRIQAYNAVKGNEKPISSLKEEETATSSLRLNRVIRTLDRAGGDWSLPLRLRHQDTQRSPVEGGYPRRRSCQEESGLDGDKQKIGSWLRDLGATGSKPNEVTGNQTISNRIEKLYRIGGSDDTKAKRHSAPVGDWLDGLPSDFNQRKLNADIGCPPCTPHGQWQALSCNVQRGGTFPRRFNCGDNSSLNDTPRPSQISRRDTLPSLSTTVTPVSSLYRAGSVERKVPHTPDVGLYTKSLERGRSRLSATAQLKHLRETETPLQVVSKEIVLSSPKGAGVVKERSLKGEQLRVTMDKDVTGEKAKESVIGIRGHESQRKIVKSDATDKLSRTKDSHESLAMANKTPESKLPEKEDAREGAFQRRKIPEKEHSSAEGFITPMKAQAPPVKGQAPPVKGSKSGTEDEDVFDTGVSAAKAPIRRQETVKGKFSTPSLESVRNTIHKFEALAQQSQSASQFLKSRRAFSVPEHPTDRGGLRKSESSHALGGRTQEGNSGSLRGNPQDKAWPMRSVSVDEVVLRQDNFEKSEKGLKVETTKPSSQITDPKSHLHKDAYKKRKDMDEPDFHATSVHPVINTVAIQDSVKSNSKPELNLSSHHQNNWNNNSNGRAMFVALNDPAILGGGVSEVSHISEGDADRTPTNSPERLPLFPTLNGHLPTPSKAHVSSDDIHHPPGPDSEPPTPTNSFQSTQDPLFNHGSASPTDCPPLDRLTLLDKAGDSGPFSVSVARWSSDEEDDEENYDTQRDDNSDSDSGESCLTITSHMSLSDRRSFSVSLSELCSFGGVDYSPPEDSEEEADDWPPGRSASLSSDMSVMSCVTLLGTEELDSLLQDVRSLGDDTLQNYEDVQVVVLHKDVGIGLGFTVAGGIDQNKPVTVHKVFSHGVADQEGSIRGGDLVLSINGTTLQNSAHWEALRTLRKARGRDMAVVVLQRGGVSGSRQKRTNRGKEPSSTAQGETGRQLHVTLKKRSSDLGFSLEGGVGSSLGDRPLAVQKLFQGGPVGEVCPGDELLEVEGRSMTGLMRLEAWQLIKKLPIGPVKVLLRRPHKPH